MSAPEQDEAELADLLLAWEDRAARGEDAAAGELCGDRPDLVPRLAARIDLLKRVRWTTAAATDDPTASPAARASGETLAGRYRLDARIGEGGFGQVWRGFDLELRRPVAVKFSHGTRPPAKADEAILAEARRVAGLSCPGVVPVYDVGRHRGTTFLVSELVDGSDLACRLRAGPLSVRDGVRVVAEAARSIHEAHCQGFVHRDVKPANLLLARDGRVLVTDFGIAVSAADPGAWDGAGTLSYMAPEQLFPGGSRVDARTDVYALGVVLYLAVTGQLPFPAAALDTLRQQILTVEPRPPRAVNRSVPAAVDRIVMRCLAKSPANRYPTALALAEDLSDWLRRGRVGRLAVNASRSFARLSHPVRRRAGGIVGAALAALVVLGAGYALRRGSGSGEPTADDAPSQATGPVGETWLFTGSDLTGWGFHPQGPHLDPAEAVRVENGVLAFGHQRFFRLCTAERFEDFVLTLEYRYPPGGTVSNAGGAVLLRVVAPDRMAQHHLRVHLNRRSGDGVRLPGSRQPAAEDEGGVLPSAAGEWNTLEVRCVGPVVTAAVNGRQTGRTTEAPVRPGHLGLTTQGSDLEFRAIRLRPAR